MNITRLTESPAILDRPVLFGIGGCDPSQAVDVEIVDAVSGATAGVKRLCGLPLYSVDVAPYLRNMTDIRPAREDGRAFVQPERWTAAAFVRTEGVESDTVAALYARQCPAPGQKLSNAPEIKTIGPGEYDLIAFVAQDTAPAATLTFGGPQGEYAIEVANAIVQGRVTLLPVNTAALQQRLAQDGRTIGQFRSIGVRIVNGPHTICQQYRIEPAAARQTRLAWINPLGGIDHYSFAETAEQTVSADKTIAQSAEGQYAAREITSGETVSVVSRCETPDTARWIAELIAAPRVWIDRDGEYLPVAVASRQAVTETPDIPVRIKLSLTHTCNHIL